MMKLPKSVPLTRTFNGKKYDLAMDGYTDRAIAQRHADGLKAKGMYLARVVVCKNKGFKPTYAVYGREK